MNLINNTPYPTLNFEGVNPFDEAFHVVVTRQTYTWDEQGLLILSDEQDSLRMQDELVDATDIMSGVLEESDLCHYKPKCDVIVKGHAYTPTYKKSKSDFIAGIQVQTPDKLLYSESISANKYQFTDKATQKKKTKNKYVKGDVLVDKKLSILSPRCAHSQLDSVTGNIRYQIKTKPIEDKVSLNPSSSFGGYCYIEADNPVIDKINDSILIPEADRAEMRINDKHGLLAYFAQDSHNPAGTGSYPNIYHHAIKPKTIDLPQIHTPYHYLKSSHIEQMANKQLDSKAHSRLVNGFGLCSKSHPDRIKYTGTLDQAFIDSDKQLPEDFDFAIWNCAYPDQQVAELKGDEWITLTNLCRKDTLSATQNEQGDTILNLYLPEDIVYLLVSSTIETAPVSEVPLKIDTLIISPDEQKVNIVWRGIVDARYPVDKALLEKMDRKQKEAILAEHFTQKGEVIRPYENEVSG